jgi:hypothetical protein
MSSFQAYKCVSLPYVGYLEGYKYTFLRIPRLKFVIIWKSLMVTAPYKLYCTPLSIVKFLEWANIKLSVGTALFHLCCFKQLSKYNFKQTQQSVTLDVLNTTAFETQTTSLLLSNEWTCHKVTWSPCEHSSKSWSLPLRKHIVFSLQR